MKELRKTAIAIALLVAASIPASAQAPDARNIVDRDGFAAAVGWDFEGADVTATKARGAVSVLFGVGGNIAASIGPQGVLLVDDQFPELLPKIEETIVGLGGGKIDFVINTHWHFDHADGNMTLGAKGAWLVSHLNSRNMLLDDHLVDLVGLIYDQKAYPTEARPVITYQDRMQLFFNGERIDLMNFGPAHTTGDTAVIFRSSNVVHLGDVFNASGYPFIDAGNGGSLDGVIEFCKGVLEEIDQDTIVVPGHGAISTYADLEAYVDMLEQIRDRMLALIAGGASLLEVIESKPTAEWDAKMGDPVRLLDRAYLSLVRSPVSR